MGKLYYEGDIKKIDAEDFRKVGKVTITNSHGEKEVYQGLALKGYVRKIFKGGKTAFTFGQHLKNKAKVVDKQVDKRNKLIKVIAGGTKTKQELRVAERSKNMIRQRNIAASRMSEMLQAKRSDRMSGILKEDGNTKTTSERIGVASRKFGVHYGVSAIDTDSRRSSINQNSIENIVAEHEAVPLTGFASGSGVGKKPIDAAAGKNGQLSNFGAGGMSGKGNPGSNLLNFFKK